MKGLYKTLTAILTAIVGVALIPGSVLAFGITPAEINVLNLSPGSHYEDLVYVTRPISEADEKLKVTIDAQLGNFSSWVSFDPGSEFDFPTGKNTTSFKVIIDVPQDARLTNYKGKITVTGVPEVKASEGVTMQKGAILQLNLTTTSNSYAEFDVLSIKAPDVNMGDPVRLLLNIENKGNAAAAPDSVSLEVMDLFERPIESLEDASLENIPSFTTKEIQADFDSDLEIGQYRLNAYVFYEGREIAREKMVLTVNAKPQKADVGIPSRDAAASFWNDQPALILMLSGFILLALIALHILRTSEVTDPDFEKRIAKLLKHNKKLSLVLIAVSLMMIATGFLILLTPAPTNKNADEEVEQSTVTPTETPEVQTQTPSETESSDVKGVSIQAEEPSAPLMVKRPGSEGLYPIYFEPEFDSEIMYEAKDGETFDVVKQVGDWYNVVLDDGTSGWLHETSIKEKN